MNILDRISGKGLSGRYFLTVISGIAFLICVKHKILDSQAIATIISMVFSLYFSRGNDTTIDGQQK